jgi:hypothetical protein
LADRVTSFTPTTMVAATATRISTEQAATAAAAEMAGAEMAGADSEVSKTWGLFQFASKLKARPGQSRCVNMSACQERLGCLALRL